MSTGHKGRKNPTLTCVLYIWKKKQTNKNNITDWNSKIQKPVPDMTYNVLGGTLNLTQQQSTPEDRRQLTMCHPDVSWFTAQQAWCRMSVIGDCCQTLLADIQLTRYDGAACGPVTIIALQSPANKIHRHALFLWPWPWPWPDDLDRRTGPEDSEDIPA